MNDRVFRKREGKSPSVLQYAVEAITVGSGRGAEPYILAFQYSSDNVAGRSLGTLFGFFEVEIHDNDAAYIVNFLASVAKKEYFANPRRDVEDGFETTLHKINVALAEIAKEGNISWLGHLHGIVAAISRDTVYFSATGDGVLSLARDGSFRPISDGLAEVLSEPHPLKTFTEVASGKLIENDVLLVLSPTVWTLFTPDDLKKNIIRLGKQGFSQFLHTALINELPMAAAVIVNAAKEIPPSTEPKKATPEPVALDNMWSERPFAQARMARQKKPATISETPAPPKEKEYIDQKTGHIYLQGDTPSTTPPATPWQASLALSIQSLSQTWQKKQTDWQRTGRRTKKQISLWWAMLGVATRTTGKRLSRRGRTVWRRFREERARRQEDKAASPVAITPAPSVAPPTPTTPPPVTTTWRTKWQAAPTQAASEATVRPGEETRPPSSPQWKIVSITPVLKNFVHRIRITFTALANTLRHSLVVGTSWIQRQTQIIQPWWLARTRRQQAHILGGAILLLTVGLATYWYSGRSPLWDTTPVPAAPIQETAPSTPTVLGQDEPHATVLSESRVLFPLEANESVVSLDTLDRVPYVVTTKRLINLTTQESVALPTKPRLAAAMDDLNGIFLLEGNSTLTFYTPSNKKFATNALTLPVGARIDAIDCSLTYLYVLDRAAGTIYRFPRAEGGFGTPITWSKAPFTTEATSPMFVSDNIVIVQPNGLPATYERGRPTTTTFAPPVSSAHVTALIAAPETADLWALDSSASRVIRWQATGALAAQYFHSDLGTATHLLLANNTELLVARPNGITTFTLP